MRTSILSASTKSLGRLRGPAWLALAFLGSVGLLAACKQNVGERCQLTDDCAPGLVCEFGGNTPAMGGYCKDPKVTTNNTVDMATADQASSGDMSADM